MRDVVAWAAGFIDGEGCVDLKKNKKSCTPRVRVSQVDIRPLIRLQTYWGGKIYPASRMGDSCYEWYLSGEAALYFLERISRTLCNKREEAELLLANAYLWRDPPDNAEVVQDKLRLQLQAMKKG